MSRSMRFIRVAVPRRPPLTGAFDNSAFKRPQSRFRVVATVRAKAFDNGLLPDGLGRAHASPDNSVAGLGASRDSQDILRHEGSELVLERFGRATAPAIGNGR